MVIPIAEIENVARDRYAYIFEQLRITTCDQKQVCYKWQYFVPNTAALAEALAGAKALVTCSVLCPPCVLVEPCNLIA